MRKVIVGLVVALIAGVGGYFGVDYWAQRAVAREVDAMLDGWRASIGSATRGRVEVDLWKRTVKITDVVVQARSAPHPKLTIAQVVASGIDVSGKPARVVISDFELSEALPGQPGAHVQYKAPGVTLTGFSARPLAPRKAASSLDLMRIWLELLSVTTAASIEAPSLAVAVTPGLSAMPPGGGNGLLPPGAFQIAYTNLVLLEVRDGRIARATADGAVLRAGVAGRPAREVKGEIGKIAVVDADVGPMLALLDPARPKGQGYQRIYGQISMGPYTLRFNDGSVVSVAKVHAEDVGLHPDKLSLDDMLFLSEVTAMPGGAASPAQATMLLDKVAGLYEGVSLGKVELEGLSATSMRDHVKMAGMRIERLENGRLGEISFEGIDARPAIGAPVRFGRIALKGFDVAGAMRLMGRELAAPRGQPPSFDRFVGTLNLLEGFELKSVAVPDPKTGRMMHLDASVASGKFVGSIPSEVRAALKLSTPIGAANPEPFFNLLAAAGVRTLVARAELAVTWSEATEIVALQPATFEIGSFMAFSVKASAAKVGRGLFTTDVLKAIEGIASVEVGPIEATVRDLGLVDLLAADTARTAGLAPEAGRSLLLERWTRNAQMQTQLHPEARPFFEAVSRFLQGKGETLTVRLTPKGRVRLLELIEAVRLDPGGGLLAGFAIEASSGR